jgi:hypothetical protein
MRALPSCPHTQLRQLRRVRDHLRTGRAATLFPTFQAHRNERFRNDDGNTTDAQLTKPYAITLIPLTPLRTVQKQNACISGLTQALC